MALPDWLRRLLAPPEAAPRLPGSLAVQVASQHLGDAHVRELLAEATAPELVAGSVRWAGSHRIGLVAAPSRQRGGA